MLEQINWDNTLSELTKVGTMLLVSRLFVGGDINDIAWRQSSLFTLMGFATYHVFTANVFDTSNFTPTVQAIANDWIEVGTMLVVSQALAGQPFNEAWFRGSLFTLLGFTAYNLFTANLVDSATISDAPGVQAAIDDWAKVGTMLIVSRLLAGGDLNDPAWTRASLGTLLGFTTYNLLIKGLLKNSR